MRRTDDGIILVNVLVALALGSALVVLMFTSQDNLIDRTRRAAAATQAEALALGGEASVVAALQRDLITGPDTDNYTEDWALIQQAPVQLTTGTFSVTIVDAQALFDINQLADGGLVKTQVFTLLIAQAGIPASVGQGIINQVRSAGPLADLDALRDLDDTTLSTLKARLVALPIPGNVNLNTATMPVLSAVLGNPATASRLLALRDRQGFITPTDLANLGGLAATGIGFTSDVYDVKVTAGVDDAVITLNSRILRLRRTPAEREVRVISRKLSAPALTQPSN
jgi:general secretion pathway protein K